MNEIFDLPVNHNSKNSLFPSQLVQVGYTHKLEVKVNGILIFFEPDEEGNYRALTENRNAVIHFNHNLLQSIAKNLHKVVR